MTAIRNFCDLSNQRRRGLEAIDPGLKDSIRQKREQDVQKKYEEHMNANLDKIKAGRQHFEAARLREADPMAALIRKAWRCDDTRPGMAAVCTAMETMAPAAQLSLAKELNHPVLALQAVSNIKKMDMDPQTRMALEPAVSELTHGYVDKEKIREHAQTELACLEVEVLAHKDADAPTHEIMALGHRLEALRKIIATGELPKSERISALSHPNPVDRMQAARKAG